jgi:hypothetical protein
MSRKTVIKRILSEVAGISFEVREWAKTIEDYVKEYVASEREKMKSQNPQPTQKPPTQNPTSFSWSAPSEELESGFTHFEDDDYKEYQTANIYADELFINSDILQDFPGIKSAVTGKLFSVTFDDEGRFFIDTVGSKFPENFREAIEEMIEDHMVIGEAFYTEDYELVYASSYDDDNYSSRYDYMSEDNRSSYEDDYADWRRNRGNDYGYSGGYSYSYTPQPKIDKIEIDGNDFPKAYKNFNVDKWIITPSNRIEYDHWKSGYNEAGQYVVYLNMPLSSVGGSALIHEIKHAYDDWNRMRKGAPPIRDGWEIQNIYTPDFEKLVLGGSFKISPMLHPIIRYYYLGSKLEAPAYLENEYDSPVMGSYRDTAKKLMNFKASNFLDKKGNPAKGLQESWSGLIAEYNIPFFRKFKNVVDFLNYTEKYFNKRGRDILRRIDKMKYVHGKPMTTQAPPKVYTKPATVTQPTQTASGLPKPKTNLNQVEIERLDKQIDRLEDEWDKLNLDPQRNKMDLDEIDLIVRELLNKRNRLLRDGEVDKDLPF